MARGPRKARPLAQQITEKEELLRDLEGQLKEEKEALKALKQALAAEEVEKLQKFIAATNLTPEKAIEILQEHTNTASETVD